MTFDKRCYQLDISTYDKDFRNYSVKFATISLYDPNRKYVNEVETTVRSNLFKILSMYSYDDINEELASYMNVMMLHKREYTLYRKGVKVLEAEGKHALTKWIYSNIPVLKFIKMCTSTST